MIDKNKVYSKLKELSSKELSALESLPKVKSLSPFSGKEAYKNVPFSWVLQDVIYASVLGDGHIQKQYERGDARILLEHSGAQEDYLKWKVGILKLFLGGEAKHRIRDSRPGFNIDKKLSGFFRYTSPVNSILTDIYYDLFKQKEDGRYKVNLRLKWLNRFTALGLMIWYLDDAHLHPRDREIIISVHSLGEGNILKLRKYLKSAWDLDCRIEMTKIKGTYCARLRFSTNQSKKFIRIIMPVVPRECKSMLYKLCMVYKQHEPQQRWISDLIEFSQFTENEIAEFYRNKITDKLFVKCFPNVKLLFIR